MEVSAPSFGSWTLCDAAVMADGLNLTVLLTSSDQSLTDTIAQLAPASPSITPAHGEVTVKAARQMGGAL